MTMYVSSPFLRTPKIAPAREAYAPYWLAAT